jgi:hypothetical protein
MLLHGEMRNAYKILVCEPEGKRQFEIPRCRWEDNIKMRIREIGRDVMNRIQPAQNRI